MPVRDRAVLQRRRVVVELDKRGKHAPYLARASAAIAAQPVRRDVRVTPPGHDRIHHQTVAESGAGRAQRALAQNAALRVHQREGGVVADRADVAEMIGEALELGHQRAQINARAAESRSAARLRPRARTRTHRRPCCRPRCVRRACAARRASAPAISHSMPLCT